MKRTLRIGSALALALAATAGVAQPLQWRTIANNADVMPGSTLTFSSFNQPSVNSDGLVVFRARSKGADAGGEAVNSTEISARPSLWSTIAADAPTAGGGPVHGIYARQMVGIVFGSAITEVTARGKTVPQPNNALINGALATFEEFPSTPRIDIGSPTIATRGQSQPVYEYQVGVDPTTGLPLTTKVGTSGVYTNPGNVLLTGASLLGAVTDFPAGTVTFPHYSVPGAAAGTRFDQFPGAPTVTNGTVIAFKGNYTDPSDGLGRTGVYYRDVVASSGKSAIQLVANSNTVIPNPPGAPVVKFGSTAPPSAANGYMVFTGLDIEEAPTRGGIYRAPLQPSPPLQTLAGIGTQVPGEAAGVGFTAFGEGLSISSDGRFTSFWGAWGSETFTKVLNCPVDGNAEIVAYCAANYPTGHVATIPVHQGIFVADAQSGKVYPVAKTLADGYVDFLYWVFSGRPPGTGGGDEPAFEPPRWRSSAFAALYGVPGWEVQTAFKASRSGYDGIYVRQGRSLARPLLTVVETQNTAGTAIDPMAPANSVVTVVGVERDGFRNGNLVIAASMLFADPVTPLGWAGIYFTRVAAIPFIPDPPDPVASTTTLASSANPASLGAMVTFTATVAGSSPTGTVGFTADGGSIAGCGAVALAAGFGSTRTATCSTAALTLGVHAVVASYSGDAANLASASAPLSQVISESLAQPTATSLASSANPAVAGAVVTFTATVNGTSPTGTVGFTDDGAPIPGCAAVAVTVAGFGGTVGTAKCSTSGLGVGTHQIVAGYSGDAANAPSASTPLSQLINSGPAPTTTTLVSSLNPSTAGTSVTFTATVAGSAPTGTVAFLDGRTTIAGCGAQPLNASGQATCTTSSLAAGTHGITAGYGGDASNLASASAELSQVVNPVVIPPLSVVLKSSLNPSSVGVAVTFTATVTGNAPTGTVRFTSDGATISGCTAVALTGSGNTRTAVCTTSGLTAGGHGIRAAYSGDVRNAAATSPSLLQFVLP